MEAGFLPLFRLGAISTVASSVIVASTETGGEESVGDDSETGGIE